MVVPSYLLPDLRDLVVSKDYHHGTDKIWQLVSSFFFLGNKIRSPLSQRENGNRGVNMCAISGPAGSIFDNNSHISRGKFPSYKFCKGVLLIYRSFINFWEYLFYKVVQNWFHFIFGCCPIEEITIYVLFCPSNHVEKRVPCQSIPQQRSHTHLGGRRRLLGPA